MKFLKLVVLPVLLFTVSCKKDKQANVSTPVPFLTAKRWTCDTITVNLPATYNLLSTADQQIYRHALAWFKNAQLTLNEDGTVTTGGDYDFGYYKWRLINNNADIEMQVSTGTKDTLFNWNADNLHFMYGKRFTSSYDCTLIYK